MGSLIERSSSSRSSTPLIRGGVVIAFDATKIRNIKEVKDIVCHVMKREEIIQESSTITVLGVLDKVLHPMGFQIQIGPESFVGAHVRAVKEEVSRKVDAYVSTLVHCAEEYDGKGVDIKVKIVVGVPIKNVLVQEIVALQATWAIIDRQLKKDLKFYVNHIPCQVALIRENLSVAVLRAYRIDKSIETMNHKLLYSLSKPVSPSPAQDNESDKQSVSSLRSSDLPNGSMMSLCESKSKEHSISLQDESRSSPQQEIPGSRIEQQNNCQIEQGNNYNESPQEMQEESSLDNHFEVPVLYTSSTTKEQEAVDPGDSKMQNEPVEFLPDTLQQEGIVAIIENGHDGSPQVTKALQKHDDVYYPGIIGKIKNGHIGSPQGTKPLPKYADLYHPDDTIGGVNPLGYSFSNILTATDNFSCDNFLGEGEYGVVYKGKLENGQLIAVKVQDEASEQGVAAFTAEVYALSFARHANIVTLLGYCCNENLKILVYKYISNKSLEWHLFEEVLEWNRRHDIAIGTAKGLRFLHEECKGSPIIHRDMRPSNILLTHDFVPMLGDFGLAKWKTNKFDKQRRVPGNLEYLAPEYAENGISSVKTDVYAFGLLLLQLISGRKAVDSTRDDQKTSIRQWALPLIETLALHELVDPRLGDAYCTYEVYNMARAAYFCVQTNSTLRPTMGEVLCILEGTNDHLRYLTSNLYPMIINTEDALS